MGEGNEARDREEQGLRFSVLGPLEASLDGERLNLGGAKQQMVLARLLLDPGHAVPTERLTAWVWPDTEDPTRHSATLQVYVSNLRRLLVSATTERGESIIVTRRPGYQIDLASDQLDLLRFRQESALGQHALREGRPAIGAEHLRNALSLWRGEPLAGLPIDAGQTGPLARLGTERIATIEALAGSELATGRHREALADLQAWVEEHPSNEELRSHLMLALYRCGRQAEALASFQDLRRTLVDDFGIEPSRELRELEAKILDQDRSLDLAPTSGGLADGHTTALRSSVLAPQATISVDGTRISVKTPVTTLGRLADCDVVIDDTSVSRRHAEIRRVGDVHRIVDIGSANGTIVNGVRVIDQVLVDGDVIRLGGKEIGFSSPSSRH